MTDQEFITGVAIRCEKLIFSMPRPARHHNIMAEMADCGVPPKFAHGEQGFITSWGKFVTRSEAKPIAAARGQIIRDTSGGSDDLYSEDVW